MSELRERFLNAMLRRANTSKQAREFLLKCGAGDSEIDSLMSEAEELGLIDDEGYARLFVDGHIQWGNLKIAHELSLRGVGREEIEIALDEAEAESKRARELAESWRRAGVEERKIASRLGGRGFTRRAISSVIER